MLTKPRFRFTIRSILILTALVAVAVWWLTAPSATARRFTNAIGKEQYSEAAEMFLVDGAASMLTDWQPLVDVHAVPLKLSLNDLVRGRRAIYLSVKYQLKVSEIAGFFPLEADCRGIHKLEMKSSDLGRFKIKQQTTAP